ncbi:MAG TPA: ATP-binding cassette domain-containing protein [Polyangiaceae bacterium]|jgi:ABC-type bacteriocin/lantibiotic exporter with double-glycine peptidase domain
MSAKSMARAKARLIPEVVQTSATDCGPASMKSVLAGMGLALDYRALREACQTDVDGTSIDTLEELAKQLGLEADQVMLPLDHVFLDESRALPAIIVTLTPGGRPHFVVLWSRVGPFIQVMDPATGRHWTTIRALASRLYQHTTAAPSAAWREWAASEEALAALRRRLRDVGAQDADQRVAKALEDPGYWSLAALDAAVRAVEAVIRAGAVGRGRTAGRLVTSMMERAKAGEVAIPDAYWSVRPNPDTEGENDDILLTGAVLLRFRGWREDAVAAGDAAPSKLPPDLANALRVPPLDPRRTLGALLARDPWSIPLSIALGLLVTTAGRIVQALILRAVLDLGRDLGTVKQRTLGMLVLAAVALVLLLVQVPISLGLLGIGRRLEVRLRQAYFEKLPKTEDRYFQSRLASDMASRCHAIQSMRTLPNLLAQAMTTTLEVLATAGALAWAAPGQWRIVAALAACTLLLPVVAQWFFSEPDMRIQTHAGALNSFILNGLLGLTPIRIHGAERSLRRGQEALLVEWTRARYSLQALSVAFEGLTTTATYALVVWLVFAYLRTTSRASMVLLLVFWALRFPALGQRLLVLTRSFPSVMNRARRLLEMIGTIEPSLDLAAGVQVGEERRARGIAVAFDRIRVKGGGHTILDKVSVDIAPGEHVAIVGPSGAGKSTLVGLLLGWLRPARGEIRVDGKPLDQPEVERLRRATAWVDPAIHLWNQSLLDNLRYGNDSSQAWSLDAALRGADMLDILEALPEGLQTSLGEGGGLVSGGQGQRVRLARAMLRSNVRLAILDEPFRGLDRERRARLLQESRRLWADITLFCVTHDVVQTTGFDRVLVVEGGRVVENGPPAELLAREGSRYGALVRADEENHRLLWSGGAWRHWWLANGELREKPAA